MKKSKAAVKFSGDRQLSQRSLAATARDAKFDESDMKTYQNQKISFKFSWLTRASIACFTGFLAVACTPSPQPPTSKASIKAAPANAISPNSSQASKSEVCKITMAKVADPKPPTNVRSAPEVKPNNIVGQIKNGTLVSVNSEKNGWFEINKPLKGWISKTATQSDCNEKIKRVNFPSNSSSATISGRFIGPGHHDYLVTANQGQVLKVTVKEGPLPFVFSPNDTNRQKDLTGGGSYSGKTIWTGTVAETGDYIIQLDSNRSGYEYKFSIEAK